MTDLELRLMDSQCDLILCRDRLDLIEKHLRAIVANAKPIMVKQRVNGYRVNGHVIRYARESLKALDKQRSES